MWQRALIFVAMLVSCALPRLACAHDACETLVYEQSLYFSVERCAPLTARRDLLKQLNYRCNDAIEKGEAPASLALLRARTTRPDKEVRCGREQAREAMLLVCVLHPPNERAWIRRGAVPDPYLNADGRDREVMGACLNALLNEGDVEAVVDAMHRFGSLKVDDPLRFALMAHLSLSADPEIADAYVPLIHEVGRQKLRGFGWLREVICGRDHRLTPKLRAACAEMPPDEDEDRQWKMWQRAEERRMQNRKLGKQIGLTILGVTLAGLQLGLTIPFRDQQLGRVFSTFGGIAAGTFAVFDISIPVLGRYWPLGLAGLPLGVIAGGAIGYGASYHPASTIVFASVNAAFSLTSGLVFTWRM